ncbi:hypothetical protein [Streptomyces olivochromogenes]|nr:hypothetical protein [Streptomyces olivochromogenes]
MHEWTTAWPPLEVAPLWELTPRRTGVPGLRAEEETAAANYS